MILRVEVKRLHLDAIMPVCAHPGSDLGIDVFALEDFVVGALPVKVRTGIALAVSGPGRYGLIVKDRSSVAARGVLTHGGVIDLGYRGEIIVLMSSAGESIAFAKGTKIAQLVPVPVFDVHISEVDALDESDRGVNGFGSTGAMKEVMG